MSIYDYKVKDTNGEEISLSAYEGKVLLIVNTATGCGFTPQYEGLQNLYEKYGKQILNFFIAFALFIVAVYIIFAVIGLI